MGTGALRLQVGQLDGELGGALRVGPDARRLNAPVTGLRIRPERRDGDLRSTVDLDRLSDGVRGRQGGHTTAPRDPGQRASSQGKGNGNLHPARGNPLDQHGPTVGRRFRSAQQRAHPGSVLSGTAAAFLPQIVRQKAVIRPRDRAITCVASSVASCW